MFKFKTKIESSNSDEEFDFECFDNDIPIEIGDKYIFFFGGIADVQICDSDRIKSEINKQDRPYNEQCIDLVHNFWSNCFKINWTNFDLNTIN